MIYPYRCSNKTGLKRTHKPPCGRRITLTKPEPGKRCPSCDAAMYLDKGRRKWTKKQNCRCDGLPFQPHRRGSTMYYEGMLLTCIHYEGYPPEPEEHY